MTKNNVAPVFSLLILAPWIGEFLLGSSPLPNLPYIWLLIPIYGGGALLIRETAKRFNLGLTGVLCFAAAYGIIQTCLVDQSLFNNAYFGETATQISLEDWADNALSYIANHIIWSISVPIALVEMLFPARKDVWLRKRGLILAGILYIVGCIIVFSFTYDEHKFLASPYQLAGSIIVTLLIILTPFIIKKIRGSGEPSSLRPIRPWIMGICSFVFSSLFIAKPENWTGTIMGAILLAIAFPIVILWSNNREWKIWHKFSIASGATLTCAWMGFVVTLLLWPEDKLAWTGNIVFALIAIVLLVVISRRISSSTKV